MFGFPIVFPMLAVLAFAALCWLFFGAGRRDFRWLAPPPAPDEARGQAVRTTSLIPTPSGDRIEAWLYRPAGPPAPVILMAPGLCGTKEGPLERFAEGFASAGYAVLAFDFRSFGGSEGKLLRRALQAVAERRDTGDLTTMEDPAALQQVKAMVEG